MPSEKPARYRLELTPRQQEEIRSAIGRTADILELTLEELEERIAPKIAMN